MPRSRFSIFRFNLLLLFILNIEVVRATSCPQRLGIILAKGYSEDISENGLEFNVDKIQSQLTWLGLVNNKNKHDVRGALIETMNHTLATVDYYVARSLFMTSARSSGDLSAPKGFSSDKLDLSSIRPSPIVNFYQSKLYFGVSKPLHVLRDISEVNLALNHFIFNIEYFVNSYSRLFTDFKKIIHIKQADSNLPLSLNTRSYVHSLNHTYTNDFPGAFIDVELKAQDKAIKEKTIKEKAHFSTELIKHVDFQSIRDVVSDSRSAHSVTAFLLNLSHSTRSGKNTTMWPFEYFAHIENLLKKSNSNEFVKATDDGQVHVDVSSRDNNGNIVKFRMIYCQKKSCLVDGKNNISYKKNEVISIVPTCGPDVFSLPTTEHLNQIIDYFNNNGRLNAKLKARLPKEVRCK